MAKGKKKRDEEKGEKRTGERFFSSKFCGGRGSSAVERATPGEEVPGSIPAVAVRSLQVGSVSV